VGVQAVEQLAAQTAVAKRATVIAAGEPSTLSQPYKSRQTRIRDGCRVAGRCPLQVRAQCFQAATAMDGPKWRSAGATSRLTVWWRHLSPALWTTGWRARTISPMTGSRGTHIGPPPYHRNETRDRGIGRISRAGGSSAPSTRGSGQFLGPRHRVPPARTCNETFSGSPRNPRGYVGQRPTSCSRTHAPSFEVTRKAPPINIDADLRDRQDHTDTDCGNRTVQGLYALSWVHPCTSYRRRRSATDRRRTCRRLAQGQLACGSCHTSTTTYSRQRKGPRSSPGRYESVLRTDRAEFGPFFEGCEMVPNGDSGRWPKWRAEAESQPRPTAATPKPTAGCRRNPPPG